MSMLAKVITGPVKKPHHILVFGGEGVGKSTWASQFPKPIFLSIEDGSNHLDVARLFPKSTTDILATIAELIKSDHPYETLVLDSADHLEIIIWGEVCKDSGKPNIADIPWGGGYVQALNRWKEIIEALKILRERMNIVWIAHSIVKSVNDPSLPMAYDKHMIKLHQKAADYLKESVDAVLFAHYEVFVSKKDTERTGRAFGDGKRILSTMATPGAEGKNRMSLPPTIPLDYDAFFEAVEKGDPNNVDQILSRISHYIPQIKEDLRAKVEASVKKAGRNSSELTRIEHKLKTLMETV